MLRRLLTSAFFNRVSYVLRDVLYALAGAIFWVSLVFACAVLLALALAAITPGPVPPDGRMESIYKDCLQGLDQVGDPWHCPR